jgi:subtilisin family serine protease
MERFHDEHGVTIVNNSWNTKPGWWLDTNSWHGDLWAFGFYHERAAAADALVRDTDLLVLFSGGDKRQVSFLGPHTHGDQYGSEDGLLHEDLHPPNPRYPSIAGAAVAKNVLTVGGTTKEDEIDLFSSFGPTDDGRVKPDLVAVGLDVLTTAAADGYVATAGTSISSSVVAGIAALLTDYSRRRHGRDPSSSVLKALLIHSTRDLGEPGPDYHSGFGMADAELAARVLDAAVFDDDVFRRAPRRAGRRMGPATPAGKSTGSARIAISPGDGMRTLVIEEVLDQGESVTFALPVMNGDDELRATLVWHDPPGSVLVNDLDLRVVAPDGRVILPFVLDPDQPSAAASRGENHRDNVEQIRVHGPMAGDWRILVEGAAVADGPQELALTASAGEGNRAPERLFEGDLVIDEFFVTGDASGIEQPRPWTVFSDDDPLNFYIESTILANADYGDFFGSTTVTTSVSDANGDTVVRFSASGHATGPGQLRFLFAVGLEIPAEMPAGDYTAHVGLAMHNGVERTADYPFTVEPPG